MNKEPIQRRKFLLVFQCNIAFSFCQERLLPLKPFDNSFLKIVPIKNSIVPYAFFVNRSVWVEVYYTENIPMRWGRFDKIVATGAGSSRIGGKIFFLFKLHKKKTVKRKKTDFFKKILCLKFLIKYRSSSQ